MSRSEPVTLYAPAAASYELLSLRTETSPESARLAIRARGNGGKALPKNAPKNREYLQQQLQKSGGLWAHVTRVTGEAHVSVTTWLVPGYQPPDKVLVLEWGDTIREHRIASGDVVIRSAEHVLVPVDKDAENQLDGWIAGLKGLPGDLRIAMLHGIIRDGVLDGERLSPPALASTSRPESSLAWLWIVLAALLGVGAGGAAGYFGLTYQANAGAKTKAGVVKALKDLEEREKLSPPESYARKLYETHVAPFRVEPVSSTEHYAAATWMALKLALYDPAVDNGESDPEWSEGSNRQAAKQFKALKAPPVKEAIMALGCLAGSPPIAPLEPTTDCSKVDWAQAKKELDSLIPKKVPVVVPPSDPVVNKDPDKKAPDNKNKDGKGRGKASPGPTDGTRSGGSQGPAPEVIHQ